MAEVKKKSRKYAKEERPPKEKKERIKPEGKKPKVETKKKDAPKKKEKKGKYTARPKKQLTAEEKFLRKEKKKQDRSTKRKLLAKRKGKKYENKELTRIHRAWQIEESKRKKRKAFKKAMMGNRAPKAGKQKRTKKNYKERRAQRRYVEIGRVVNVLHGQSRHTLAVIVDILDNHWVMIDGMCFKQDHLGKPSPRRMMNLNDLQLTRMTIKGVSYRMSPVKIGRLAIKQNIMEKWVHTVRNQNIQKWRAQRWATDLERWRVWYNRKQRKALVKAEFLKLKNKVVELAAAATRGPGKFTECLMQRGLLPVERQALKKTKLISFYPEKKEKAPEQHLLDLIPKKPKASKKKPSDAKGKQPAKPAVKPGGKPGAKPKAKAKPKAGAAKPGAKTSKPASKTSKPKPGATPAKPAAEKKAKDTSAKEAKAKAKPAAPAKQAAKPAAKKKEAKPSAE